jgi:exodeoxyribonuclease V alpha subunit
MNVPRSAQRIRNRLRFRPDASALVPGRNRGATHLHAVEQFHAITIHKSHGSEFDHAVVILPPPGSPILTRELLYTAVTRARKLVVLVGSRWALREAVRDARGEERRTTLARRLRA